MATIYLQRWNVGKSLDSQDELIQRIRIRREHALTHARDLYLIHVT